MTHFIVLWIILNLYKYKNYLPKMWYISKIMRTFAS